MHAPVTREQVAHALRRVRPNAYRIDGDAGDAGDIAIALVLDVSPGGRRNAAARIVRSLHDNGLGLDDEQPADTLAAGGRSLRVVRLP